ncbi:LPS export ABC transporter periplasmic protein LptC [Dysgonomonas sp. 216]|uniref:LPS export ABC transporter periplasmic protein LptC n=1 Tax=Dysgonomonas sp. 216 TaxID=2302934 RepID=UPI001624C029|nr:LPS export ABC transporter periplasmic protein LptC [Dysgonomonas sp. 216]
MFEPINILKRSVVAGIVMVLATTFFISCGGDNTNYVDVPFDKETIPSMAVDSVTELISDSGLIRYKVITKTWLFFEEVSEPYWYFPNGLYVEKFDTAFNIETTIIADTVWNFKSKRLWKLKGNVFVRNSKNETFFTHEMFWDERLGRIYSDKYIEINQPEKLTLKGIGFVSNQSMTEYTVRKPFDSELYYNENEAQVQKADSTAVQVTDSVNTLARKP